MRASRTYGSVRGACSNGRSYRNSDYPHPDGIWPDSGKYIENQFGHLPPEITHKIVCENAGKLYGLIN